jgi:BlaI family penicillinase repressor
MPRKRTIPELSKAEYDILRILWKDGRLTVREVHDQVYPIHKWAYTTTKTIMDRMVKKSLLNRKKYHGIYLYKPLISRPAGLVRMVRFFADRVFETDVSSVVSMFAKNNTLNADEIEELEKLLDKETK